MLLLSGQRGQVLHFLDTRNMTVSEFKVSFRIGDLLKTSPPSDHLSEIVFESYAPDKRLCIHTAIVDYLNRTSVVRGSITRFFLTTVPPIRMASRDTLRRKTKDILLATGIDLSIFSPHSTRSASSSKAALTLPLSTIISTIGWSSESTFAKFYRRPLRKQGLFARAILP